MSGVSISTSWPLKEGRLWCYGSCSHKKLRPGCRSAGLTRTPTLQTDRIDLVLRHFKSLVIPSIFSRQSLIRPCSPILPRRGRPLFAGSAIALTCRQPALSPPWLPSMARKCRFQIGSFASTAPGGFGAVVRSSITRTTRDAMQTGLGLLDRVDRDDYLLDHRQRLNPPNRIFSLISTSQCSSGITQAPAARAAYDSVFAFQTLDRCQASLSTQWEPIPRETVALRRGGNDGFSSPCEVTR
jgi:hypothetical protein